MLRWELAAFAGVVIGLGTLLVPIRLLRLNVGLVQSTFQPPGPGHNHIPWRQTHSSTSEVWVDQTVARSHPLQLYSMGIGTGRCTKRHREVILELEGPFTTEVVSGTVSELRMDCDLQESEWMPSGASAIEDDSLIDTSVKSPPNATTPHDDPQESEWMSSEASTAEGDSLTNESVQSQPTQEEFPRHRCNSPAGIPVALSGVQSNRLLSERPNYHPRRWLRNDLPPILKRP